MIKITEEQKQIIIGHAGSSDRFEACGILAGKQGRVEKVYMMNNTSDTPESCYFMDSKEQLKTMKGIRELGLEMIGIYHSHPHSEAYPSARDVELAFYPDVSYVIISLRQPGKIQFRSYRIVDEKIVEEEIKT